MQSNNTPVVGDSIVYKSSSIDSMSGLLKECGEQLFLQKKLRVQVKMASFEANDKSVKIRCALNGSQYFCELNVPFARKEMTRITFIDNPTLYEKLSRSMGKCREM